MNATVGKVQSIEGKFFAKIGSETIELKVGDFIVEGMIVFGDKNNLPSAHIEIVSNENEMIVLEGAQIQLFDSSVVGTFDSEDGIQPDNVMALLDKELYSDQIEQAAKEDDAILIEKTETSEQTPQTKDGQEASFDARDGRLVDVTTTLRDTTFASVADVEEQDDDIPLTQVNNVTTIVNDIATTNEDEAVTIDVIANDTDIDAKSPVASVTNGANGTVTLNTDGTVTYTPNTNFNGTDSFTYTNEEGNTGTVTVTVDPLTDAMSDADETIHLNEDSGANNGNIMSVTDVDS
ncbi:MAG: cadherin-like domain-containing protein, partial [Campylobacterales bacterium]|nr:cadherin-like domain-containing protein [Campylobacterales bacterium]